MACCQSNSVGSAHPSHDSTTGFRAMLRLYDYERSRRPCRLQRLKQLRDVFIMTLAPPAKRGRNGDDERKITTNLAKSSADGTTTPSMRVDKILLIRNTKWPLHTGQLYGVQDRKSSFANIALPQWVSFYTNREQTDTSSNTTSDKPRVLAA